MFKQRLIACGATLAAVGAGAAAVAATSAQASIAHPAATAPALKVETVTISKSGGSNTKHAVLVTAKGRPVYLLTGDSVTHPICTSSSCLGYWPPVTTTSMKPALGKGIKGKLTVWTHGHMHQLVLNGHPLYMFAQDSAGTAAGEGIKSFGGVWWLFSSSGTAFKGSSSGGGSGYAKSGGGSGW